MAEPKVGLYLRLSRDDGDTDESMSITNQRDFLQKYVAGRGWQVTNIYIDDGYTGTNFQRPDFQRLLKDIEKCQIDTVITKDFSRLGRDQIGTMYYYQVYFPQMQVRYIAVNEGIDTAAGNSNEIMLPFLAAYNDFYTADISRKVRSALDTRKGNGFFIGAQAPLGYQKDPMQKGHLVPDPETAPVIQNLFQIYLSCGSVIGTAKRMTEMGIPTPSEWKQTLPTQQRFPGMWNETMVRRILTNPTYAGHLTQNRARKLGYKVAKKVALPQEEWIIVPNTHIPLVSQQEFDRVQEMIRVRSYLPTAGEGHLLTGMAFCADCGSPMTYVRESDTRTYMVCQGYRKGGRLRYCTAHCMREDFVIESIRQQLQMMAQRLDAEALGKSATVDYSHQQLLKQIQSAKRKLDQCKMMMQSLYRDKTNGTLSEEEFAELFQKNRQEREQLTHYIEESGTHLEQENAQEQLLERVRQMLSFENLDRGVLSTLVDRVLIHENKEIEIIVRFRKPE